MPNHWPTVGLEPVTACPVCTGTQRAPLHDGLVDLAFNTAPGSWTIVRCLGCGSGYLDPRPTQDTIGLAYAGYYTHLQVGEESENALARLRRGIAVEYANRTCGTRFRGGIRGAHMLAWLLPRLRRYLDVRYRRHLPLPREGCRRLLDVGCGNGEFLACASAIGWSAEGIDVDAGAVSAAIAAGCRARLATLDDPTLDPGSYEHITLSHVIEHVHEPLVQLTRCLELLAPGGRLWLQTPNIDSLGHAVFGPAWRGLEPPRHLVLFTCAALREALERAGFVRIEFKAQPAVSLFIWEESLGLLRRTSHSTPSELSARLLRWPGGAVIADYWSAVRPGSAEFLTCVAFRPMNGSD